MKKRMSLHIMILTLALVMALSACSGSKAPGDGSKTGGKDLKPYTVTILTAGDMPVDQQIVLDEVAKRTKDTLNITLDIKYFPWADYIEKNKMMASAGDKFDIYLNFSFDILPAIVRKQAIKIDDYLNKYGKDIKDSISAADWGAAIANGETIAIPAIYHKDSVYNTAIVRKDLREKYNLPPITDLESCAKFLETIAKNEPNIIPSVGGGMAFLGPRVVKAKYPEVTHAGYLGAGEMIIGFWSEEGPDAFKVIDYYGSKQAKAFVEIGARGYNNSWFSKDLDKGLEGKPTFIGGKAALLNIDFYHFTQIEADMKKTVPEAKLEWAILNPEQPVEVSPSNNFAQISSSSKDPARAVMFLNWIQASQENYDLFMYGIEGKHYTLDGDKVKLPDGIDASNNPYAPTPWYFKNTKYDRNMSSDSEITISCIEFFKKAKRYPTDEKSRGFAFNPDNVLLEVGQVEKIVAEQWGPLHTGQKQGDAYEKFLKDLEKAGMPKIIAEMQKQLDAYLANKK